MSDKNNESDKNNKRIREITPETFAAFLRLNGERSPIKKSRVNTPISKTDDDDTTVDMIQKPNEIVLSITAPSIVRVTWQNAAAAAQVSNSQRATTSMVMFNASKTKHPTKTSNNIKHKCPVRKVQLKPVPSRGHFAVIGGKEAESLEEPPPTCCMIWRSSRVIGAKSSGFVTGASNSIVKQAIHSCVFDVEVVEPLFKPKPLHYVLDEHVQSVDPSNNCCKWLVVQKVQHNILCIL
jgi:hypothetical protein